MRYDDHLLHALRRAGADRYVAGAARGLSRAGEHGAVWIAAGLAGAGADRTRRRAWLRATATVATAHLAGSAVKRVVRRPRPVLRDAVPLVRAPGRHGFPSSHAASSAAAAVAFGELLRPLGAPAAAALLTPLAAGVCLSRVVAGVHYPSDVACGALLGAGFARLSRRWTAAAGARLHPGALAGSAVEGAARNALGSAVGGAVASVAGGAAGSTAGGRHG